MQEAGGLVGNFTGEADFLHAGECLAANPRVYGLMVQMLEQYSKYGTLPEVAPEAQDMAGTDDA